MYDRAAHAGIRVVAGTIIPYNTATADQNAADARINAWIREQERSDPAIAFVDTRAAVAAAGDPDRLADSPDELHPSPPGTDRWPTPSGRCSSGSPRAVSCKDSRL